MGLSIIHKASKLFKKKTSGTSPSHSTTTQQALARMVKSDTTIPLACPAANLPSSYAYHPTYEFTGAPLPIDPTAIFDPRTGKLLAKYDRWTSAPTAPAATKAPLPFLTLKKRGRGRVYSVSDTTKAKSWAKTLMQCPGKDCGFIIETNNQYQICQHMDTYHPMEPCGLCGDRAYAFMSSIERRKHIQTRHPAMRKSVMKQTAVGRFSRFSNPPGLPLRGGASSDKSSLFPQDFIDLASAAVAANNNLVSTPATPTPNPALNLHPTRRPLPSQQPVAQPFVNRASSQALAPNVAHHLEIHWRFCDRCGRDHSVLCTEIERNRHDLLCRPGVTEGDVWCELCGEIKTDNHSCDGKHQNYCNQCGFKASIKNVKKHAKDCRGYSGTLCQHCPYCCLSFTTFWPSDIRDGHIRTCSARPDQSLGCTPYDLYPEYRPNNRKRRINTDDDAQESSIPPIKRARAAPEASNSPSPASGVFNDVLDLPSPMSFGSDDTTCQPRSVDMELFGGYNDEDGPDNNGHNLIVNMAFTAIDALASPMNIFNFKNVYSPAPSPLDDGKGKKPNYSLQKLLAPVSSVSEVAGKTSTSTVSPAQSTPTFSLLGSLFPGNATATKTVETLTATSTPTPTFDSFISVGTHTTTSSPAKASLAKASPVSTKEIIIAQKRQGCKSKRSAYRRAAAADIDTNYVDDNTSSSSGSSSNFSLVLKTSPANNRASRQVKLRAQKAAKAEIKAHARALKLVSKQNSKVITPIPVTKPITPFTGKKSNMKAKAKAQTKAKDPTVNTTTVNPRVAVRSPSTADIHYVPAVKPSSDDDWSWRPASPVWPTTPQEFIPNDNMFCSRCLRRIPKPPSGRIKGSWKQGDPSYVQQMAAHEDPDRGCGIPHRLGDPDVNGNGLPNHSGWIDWSKKYEGKKLSQSSRQMQQAFVKKYPLYTHTMFPANGSNGTQALWAHDPNNEIWSGNWTMPWPPYKGEGPLPVGHDAEPDNGRISVDDIGEDIDDMNSASEDEQETDADNDFEMADVDDALVDDEELVSPVMIETAEFDRPGSYSDWDASSSSQASDDLMDIDDEYEP